VYYEWRKEFRHEPQDNLIFMDIKDKPIPKSGDISGWKLVDIEECGQKLVQLSDDVFSIRPVFFRRKVKHSIEDMYVRETVSDMLSKAAESLPDKFKFVILDAWRPIEVQEELFNSYLESFRNKNPKISESELQELVEKYCAFPSRDVTKPAPHNTGGAIDIAIIDASGNRVPMDSDSSAFAESAIRYYEEKLENNEPLTDDQLGFLRNRRLLYHTMTSVGFSNYPHEWWHFDYGNQNWGKITGNKAIYGSIKK